MSKQVATAYSTEHRVIESLYRWLNAGQPAWLCTIVNTWGSSPRPAGSVLAFHPEDGIVGSLSGGCIEEALIRQLSDASTDASTSETPYLYDYAITEQDQARYSLPCGGKLTILVEYLSATHANLEHLKVILDALTQRQRIRRRVSLSGGALALSNHSDDVLRTSVVMSGDAVDIVFGPAFNMLLLGAGDVSHYVANMAMMVGFSVTLCDPRTSFLQGWTLAGVEVIQCLPDDLIKERFNDPYCAILALAHDPRVDDMALMEALKTEAFYIGAMGSISCASLWARSCLPKDVRVAWIMFTVLTSSGNFFCPPVFGWRGSSSSSLGVSSPLCTALSLPDCLKTQHSLWV